MLIVVMGMGRSGTSVLMQVLNAAGFDCGSDWIETNDNNPRGYYERLPVMNFNISILRQASGEPDSIYPLPDEAAIERLVGAPIPVLFPESDYAVKDPRFSLTFPVWEPYLRQFDVRVIIARRREEAIAESMLRAYGIGLVQARNIIDAYNRRGQRQVERYNLRSTEIWYEDWFEAPQRNLDRLRTLIERPLDVNLAALIDPQLFRCKGDYTPAQDRQGETESPPLLRENLLAFRHAHPTLAKTMEDALGNTRVRVFSESDDSVDVRVSTADEAESAILVPKRNSAKRPPFNRYQAYNPQQQWLILVGISALDIELLAAKPLSPLAPIVVIEPSSRRLLAFFAARSYATASTWENIHWYIGEDAIERCAKALDGELSPYFYSNQSACLIPTVEFLQDEANARTRLAQLQTEFQRRVRETQAQRNALYERHSHRSRVVFERILIVVPEVSCWRMIGEGLMAGCRQAGKVAALMTTSFPPSRMDAFESLQIIDSLFRFQPDAVILLSHSSDLFLRGLENLPIPRLIWFVDHPDHLIQYPHNPNDILVPVWREFEESLRSRNAPIAQEITIGGAPINAQARDEFRCEIGFVGTIMDTTPIRRLIPTELLEKIDAIVQDKIAEPGEFLTTIMLRHGFGEDDRAALIPIITPHMKRTGMRDQQILTFYLHVECNRSRRVGVVSRLGDFDLRIYGNPDWEALLRDTPVEGKYTGEVLPSQRYYDFCRSTEINLCVNPCFPHSGATIREIDTPLCGGFILSDLGVYAGERIGEFFEPNKELALYLGEEDIADRVRHFLNNPEERNEIVMAAQRRIERDHNFRDRAQSMLNILHSRHRAHLANS